MATTDITPGARAHPGGLAPFGRRRVARIGYGTMQLEHGADEPAVAVLRRAVELGVDHLDTAEFYGAGLVNTRIRAALHPYPEHLTLVSKVGATTDPAGRYGLRPAQTPAELRTEVEANLRTLGTEQLGVVNLFPMGRSTEIPVDGDQRVDLDDQLAELVALRDAGAIGGIGLSHVDTDTLRHCLPAGIVCVQNGYNLLDRTSQAVLDLCRDHGVAWVPYSPLGSGLPGQPAVTEHPAVREAATQLGVTPAQVGLAWLLASGPQTLLIPGTRRVDHLRENLAAADVVLDHDMLTGLGA